MLPQLKLDAPTVVSLLTGFIHEQITRAGLSRAVIGLSGGIDSALSTYLTARTLGPDHILCVMMPYRTSNPDSLAHARLVVDQLGVRSETIDITPMVDALIATDPGMSPVRKGNIMARERMIVLFDRSFREQALVVGTGNKTEGYLGYTTLYGDSACAFNPLGDLYKTQVRQLSRHLGVPDVIIEKAPSADLWMGQTDEGELGFTYEEADRLLYFMIDRQYDNAQLAEEGFDPAIVASVRSLVQRNAFKRRLPPIATIADTEQ